MAGRPVTLYLDGRPLAAEEGEPIATALWAHGVRTLRRTPRAGEPRGIFCALGRCTDCVMTVDGQPNVRTCVTAVRDGMRVETGKPPNTEGPVDAALVAALGAAPVPSAPAHVSGSAPQVTIVGAGPAGLSAAVVLGELGARVAVYDENAMAGGQLSKQIHRFFGSAEHYAGVRGFEIARLLEERARKAGVSIHLQTTVFGVYPDRILGLYQPGRPVWFEPAKHLILAVGATERGLPFPGWTLPGVMGAGAAQTLMNVHRVLPGRRAVMVGAGNVGLIVAYQLLQAGVQVAAVVESAPRVGGYEVHAAKLRRYGVPILTGHSVICAQGDSAVERVTIGRVLPGGGFHPSGQRDLQVDLVCLAVGLTPQIELAQMAGCRIRWNALLGGHVVEVDENLQTSVPGVYASGDLSGIEEASVAMEEGRLAALACAEAMGLLDPGHAAPEKDAVRRRLRALRD